MHLQVHVFLEKIMNLNTINVGTNVAHQLNILQALQK
jgi:hypothetical protein